MKSILTKAVRLQPVTLLKAKLPHKYFSRILPVIIFALSKSMFFTLDTNFFFWFIFFPKILWFLSYMHIRHLQISSSHVLMKFLNSSKVSVDLILTEFQIFGPREARICVKFIITWPRHNKGILGLCLF